MKITIELSTDENNKEFLVHGALAVDDKPLRLTRAQAAPRDAYVESRWGDQELRTAISRTTALLLRDLFSGDGVLQWHPLRREERDAQVGG